MAQHCEVCGIEINDSHKRRYCGEKCYRAANNERAVTNFINSFNKKYVGRFEYISGYEHSESEIQCRCLKCGEILIRGARFSRQGSSDIRCAKCAANELTNRMADRENIRQLAQQKKYAEREARRDEKLWSVCSECGNKFKGTRAGLKYCSIECKHKHNNRYHEISRREAIKKNGNVDYSISLQRLAERDGCVCYICGREVDMSTDTNAGTYGSIDHVIPISKGGTHSWDNVRLAHRLCNTIKRDTILPPCHEN